MYQEVFRIPFIDRPVYGYGLMLVIGFLLATPVMIWFAIRKSVPLLRGMDIIAPCLMIGLAFGRIGCYLNGCCYGEECQLPWGAAFPYGSNAYVEQYENGEISVPPELTDPTQPLANGLPRLLLRNDIDAGIRQLERLTPQQKDRNPGWA